MRYIDIGIPANNKGKHNIGCLFWLLARMVLQMPGTVTSGQKWDVMVDLFFYRQPEEAKQQEEEAIVARDYGLPPADYGMGALAANQWLVQIGDQWSADMVHPPISGVPAGNFAIGTDVWDAAAAPAQIPMLPSMYRPLLLLWCEKRNGAKAIVDATIQALLAEVAPLLILQNGSLMGICLD
ncbi:hypothetical protein Golob_006870 [Gossypium lobatum]|uniref:40S ribosomal protein SA n=1 Tax=Gossypium lobatum TaxID=34289 RepID=A0A7J8NIQ7_9ROSI|nr:hypothetical protein [Gossypium lobatum]